MREFSVLVLGSAEARKAPYLNPEPSSPGKCTFDTNPLNCEPKPGQKQNEALSQNPVKAPGDSNGKQNGSPCSFQRWSRGYREIKFSQ